MPFKLRELLPSVGVLGVPGRDVSSDSQSIPSTGSARIQNLHLTTHHVQLTFDV